MYTHQAGYFFRKQGAPLYFKASAFPRKGEWVAAPLGVTKQWIDQPPHLLKTS